MNQLFLCYRRNGAQTAKLFKFYMNRNPPEIKVWYSDLEKEGNFTLDISNLINLSYGAVIFLSNGFTKGFLDKDGCINANRYRDDHREECVTVQEIIAIEKAIQMRKDFELHIINLDGATLNRRDQKVLEKVFQQAGILTEDSIAHFAQRNMNFFDTSREDEERFFNRMVGAYMPNNVQAMIRGNFSLGNHNTTVEVLSWDCHRFIPINNINFELTNEETSLYDQIEYAPVQDKPLLQDDDVLSVVRYDQRLTTNDEEKYVLISCKVCKYHLFKKALDLWDKHSFNMSAEIAHYLNDDEERRKYSIPNAIGLALMVTTSDNMLVFSKRSSKRKVRSNEFDCSIVEGLLPKVEKNIGGIFAKYDFSSREYISYECRRAFCEEICIDNSIESHIFGLILDRRYGQWNLVGMIRTRLTSKEIQTLHSTRDDTTEVNRLFFVKYLETDGSRKIDDIHDSLTLFRKDGFWDTALVTLAGTMSILGFSIEEIISVCE